MDIVQIIKDNELWVVMLYFLIKDVWPRAWSFFTKSHEKKVDQQMATLQTQQEEEIASSVAEREERRIERNFRHSLDERQTKAFEELVKSNQLTLQLLSAVNVRLDMLTSGQNALSAFITESVLKMRETVATHHPQQTQKDIN